MNTLHSSSSSLSISDTTSFKRLENQSNASNSEPSSPTTSTLTGCSLGSVSEKGGDCGDDGREDGKGGRVIFIGDECFTKTPRNKRKWPVTSHSVDNNRNKSNNNNNNSNNTIEVNLCNFIGDPLKMDTQVTRRAFCRIGFDVIILACVVLPIIVFRICGQPYKRGFFCDDSSLKYPYRESTIKAWMLYMMGFVFPASMIASVEFFRSNEKKMRSLASGSYSAARYNICSLEIADWLVECYRRIGLLIFGTGIGQLTSDIAKYSVGRLRPHFFAVCQPILYDGSTCDHSHNTGRYIEQYECLGIDATPNLLKQMSLSFPSGHAVFSSFTMIYLVVYLQQRMTWPRAKMFKHLLQFFCLMLAWYTALTRVSDHKHHWTDVLAGSVIGTLYALAVALIC